MEEEKSPSLFANLLPESESILDEPALLDLCNAHGVKGLILLAQEGINSTIAGAPDDVRVSVRRAVGGTDLGRLREAVEREFSSFDEHEQSTRTVMARLEAGRGRWNSGCSGQKWPDALRYF